MKKILKVGDQVKVKFADSIDEVVITRLYQSDKINYVAFENLAAGIKAIDSVQNFEDRMNRAIKGFAQMELESVNVDLVELN